MNIQKKYKLLLIGMLLFLQACASTQLNREEIISNYAEINLSDGISGTEAKIIGQHYLITTSDEPCKSSYQDFDINLPLFIDGWFHDKE